MCVRQCYHTDFMAEICPPTQQQHCGMTNQISRPLVSSWWHQLSSFTKFGPHFSRLFPVACMNMRFSAFLIREEFYMCPAEKNDLIKPLKPYLYLHNNANFIHFIYVSNLWIYCCLFPRILFSCEYLVCLLSAYTSWINAMIIL